MISICIPTSRPEFGAYENQPEELHLFQPFIDTLYPQITESIELVIADNLLEYRDLTKFFDPYPKLQVKVVPQDNGWIRRGYPSFSDVWNMAANAADGSHLMFLSDCVSFPPDFLQNLKEVVRKNLLVQFLYRNYNGEEILPQGHVDADFRWDALDWDDDGEVYGFDRISWSNCFGFFLIPAKMFHAVGGFDLNFEGQKELNDIELSSRLEMLGAPVMFSKKLFVNHHLHGPIYDKTNKRGDFPPTVRSNYDMIMLMRQKGVFIANQTKWRRRDLIDVVNANVSKHPVLKKQAARRWEENSETIEDWLNGRI